MSIKRDMNIVRNVLSMKKPVRCVLGAADFAKLVNGQEVQKVDAAGKPECEIILSDIGFDVMTRIISQAKLISVVRRAKSDADKLIHGKHTV